MELKVTFLEYFYFEGTNCGGVGYARAKRVFSSCRDLLNLLCHHIGSFDFDPYPEILPDINILYLHVITDKVCQIKFGDSIDQKLL